jgi:hypothetical protein
MCIRSDIEILSEWCFFGYDFIEGVTFDPDSRLRGIGEACFGQSSLESIHVPRNVDFIHPLAFVHCTCHVITVDCDNPPFSIDRDFLVDNAEKRLVRCIGESNHIHIWQDIENLGEWSFFGCDCIEEITFDPNSRLRGIDNGCFGRSSLESIHIPRNVDFIHEDAFWNCACPFITVDPNNLRFSIDQDFLVDKIEKRHIRYIGTSRKICIGKDIEVLCESCFCDLSQVRIITFEQGSQLKRIDRYCFPLCSLQMIQIPGNVEFIDKSAFAHCNCQSMLLNPDNPHFLSNGDFLVGNIAKRLIRYFGQSDRVHINRDIEILGEWCFFGYDSMVEIVFEENSRLTQIEGSCFSGCSVRTIHIPRNVAFIDESAFCLCKCQSINVDPSNPRFSIERDFLLDRFKMQLIRYVGKSAEIHIWEYIEDVDGWCFFYCDCIDVITFDNNSCLTQLKESCSPTVH